jgi:hypothetical protein
MKSDTLPVYSPFAKETFGRGMKEGEKKDKREGRAETHVHDILTVLAARNLDVTDAERERIAGSTDLGPTRDLGQARRDRGEDQ